MLKKPERERERERQTQRDRQRERYRQRGEIERKKENERQEKRHTIYQKVRTQRWIDAESSKATCSAAVTTTVAGRSL